MGCLSTPITGTAPADNATVVDVTFDSTGLVGGSYTANLCITSDDPDPGPGNETGLIIVPVTLTICPPTAVTLHEFVAADSSPSPVPLPVRVPVATLPALVGLAQGRAAIQRRR